MIPWLRRRTFSSPSSARWVTRALTLETLESREVPAFLGYDTFAVDYSDDFRDSEVRLIDPYTGGEYLSSISPFVGYRGTLTVADGDVDGDGYDDVIVGADGAGGHIKVFDGYDGTLLDSYFAFPGFRGDVSLGAGDVNGDGYGDVIAVAEGASGHVQVFDGYDGTLLHSFFAFPGFGGGVSVGAGDVNGDGYDDIIAAADGRGGFIEVFDGYDGTLLDSFFAFPGFDGSVSVSAADFLGVGYDQIVVGAGGVGAGGRVAIFDADGYLYSPGFFAFPDFDGEIGLWTGDVDGDGIPDIVVDGWPGAPDGHVEAFSGEDFDSIYGYPTY